MAKSLLQKMLDQGTMMVFRNIVGDALKSDAVKSTKAKLKELLGETKKPTKRQKDDEV